MEEERDSGGGWMRGRHSGRGGGKGIAGGRRGRDSGGQEGKG